MKKIIILLSILLTISESIYCQDICPKENIYKIEPKVEEIKNTLNDRVILDKDGYHRYIVNWQKDNFYITILFGVIGGLDFPEPKYVKISVSSLEAPINSTIIISDMDSGEIIDITYNEWEGFLEPSEMFMIMPTKGRNYPYMDLLSIRDNLWKNEVLENTTFEINIEVNDEKPAIDLSKALSFTYDASGNLINRIPPVTKSTLMANEEPRVLLRKIHSKS